MDSRRHSEHRGGLAGPKEPASDDGDICIATTPGLKAAGDRVLYHLTRLGHGPIAGRFTTFEHVLAAGDELARVRGVRLFYLDRPGGLPQLLKDFRPR